MNIRKARITTANPRQRTLPMQTLFASARHGVIKYVNHEVHGIFLFRGRGGQRQSTELGTLSEQNRAVATQDAW